MDDLLSTKEYAALHGVSQSTVRRWIQSGQIFAYKIGNKYRIPADEDTPEETLLIAQGIADKSKQLSPDDLFNEIAGEEKPEDFDDRDPNEIVDDGYPVLENNEVSAEWVRGRFSSSDEAENYASRLRFPSRIFRRASDLKYSVEIIYP